MIVWGGDQVEFSKVGGRYNPRNNQWRPLAESPITGRFDHSVVWTGKEAMIWGGFGRACGSTRDGYCANGARYDPTLDAWSVISPSADLGARSRHTAVWTGNRMIVWGGLIGRVFVSNTGSYYSPYAVE
jgi:hypothetical protein